MECATCKQLAKWHNEVVAERDKLAAQVEELERCHKINVGVISKLKMDADSIYRPQITEVENERDELRKALAEAMELHGIMIACSFAMSAPAFSKWFARYEKLLLLAGTEQAE